MGTTPLPPTRTCVHARQSEDKLPGEPRRDAREKERDGRGTAYARETETRARTEKGERERCTLRRPPYLDARTLRSHLPLFSSSSSPRRGRYCSMHSPSCCASSPLTAALRHSSFPFFRLFVPRAETSSIGHVGARAFFVSSLLPLIFFARGRVFAGRSITTEFFFRRYFELFIGP